MATLCQTPQETAILASKAALMLAVASLVIIQGPNMVSSIAPLAVMKSKKGEGFENSGIGLFLKVSPLCSIKGKL